MIRCQNLLCSNNAKGVRFGEVRSFAYLFFYFAEGFMVKELVCSDCGCEDVKLICQTQKIRKGYDVLFYFWLGVCLLVMLIGIFLIVQFIFTSSEVAETTVLAGYTPSVEPDNTFISRNLGIIMFLAGMVATIVTMLVYIFSPYRVVTQIKVVCPNCGKVWNVCECSDRISFSSNDD